jgi:DNA-binding GntR family transcriptional regulator
MEHKGEAKGVQRAGSLARAAARNEVMRSLKREIMLGTLQPGEMLGELALAARFGCSQGKVREALLVLQDEGLVKRLGYRGTQVSSCTEDEAVEMFRIRQQIECRGIRRAMDAPRARLVAELRGLVADMVEAAEDEDELELAAIDRDFHQRIFLDAGLEALQPILHRCLIHNHRFKISRSGARRDLRQTALRHTPIVDRIEAGDADAAEHALFHHIATIVDLGPDVFEASVA